MRPMELIGTTGHEMLAKSIKEKTIKTILFIKFLQTSGGQARIVNLFDQYQLFSSGCQNSKTPTFKVRVCKNSASLNTLSKKQIVDLDANG